MMHRASVASLQPGSLPGLLEVGSFEGAERTMFSIWVLPLSAAAVVLGMSAPATDRDDNRAYASGSEISADVPPLPPITILKPLTAEQAVAANQKIPFAIQASVPAGPFQPMADDNTRQRSEDCLTAAIYYEAGGEPQAGQEAVAQVILNRVRHPAFPASICGVVFQGSTLRTGCQFTFTCDGSLNRAPDRRRWAAAQAVAQAALNGHVFAPVGLSTHYHANYVLPYWATSLDKTAQVGAHIFYRWPARWGTRAAFSRKYAGTEANPDILRSAALMARGQWPRELSVIGESPIELSIDSRVELLGALGSISSSAADGSNIDGKARAFLRTVSDETVKALMVDAKADIAAIDNQGALNSRLRELAQWSGYAAFYDRNRRAYRADVALAEESLAEAVARWRAYTAMPVAPGKMTIAFAPQDSVAQCLATKVIDGRPIVFAKSGAASRRFGEDALASRSLGQHLFAGPAWDTLAQKALSKAMAHQPDLDRQIVRAVFARIEALSAGEAAGRQAAMDAANEGFRLVPALTLALRDFERGRTRYRTFADFLPLLLERVDIDRNGRLDEGAPSLTCSERSGDQISVAAAASGGAGGRELNHLSAAAGERSSIAITSP